MGCAVQAVKSLCKSFVTLARELSKQLKKDLFQTQRFRSCSPWSFCTIGFTPVCGETQRPGGECVAEQRGSPHSRQAWVTD